MRVAVDAMGGDHAPHEIVQGVAAGLRFLGDADELILYGPQDRVTAECAAVGLNDPRIRIRHCTQVIEMDDHPVTEALRQKRDSTILRMAVDASNKEVDAVITAGNTGAFVAACQLKIGVIKGVSRLGIAVVMPTFHGPVLICDVGANPTPKPHHLYEYARMCDVYARCILGTSAPRIALISIGEEDVKGTTLIKESRALIKQDQRLHLVGNAEGRDVFSGSADIFICDGFVGNVILKLTESVAEGLFKTITRELATDDAQLAVRFEPIVARIWKKHDFAEYGGAPLLGLNSVGIICHGRSDRRAISNAIRVAVEQLRINLNQQFSEQIAATPEYAS